MRSFFNHLTAAQKLCLSFIIVIILGSSLLSLPIFHLPSAPQTSYLDHLFTVISMVCVTGLSVFPISEVYNHAGLTLSMLLIQIGGLGLVTLIAFSYYTLRRKLSLSDLGVLQNSLSRESSRHLNRFLFSVYKFTFFVEIACACLLMIDFIPRFGLASGIFNSLFLAVSAFCNAGFDNLGSSSLISFQTNPIVNLTIAFLIIAGGLGFANWIDIVHRLKDYVKNKPKNLSLVLRKLKIQTRLVLLATAILLTGGTIITWLIERHNPNTIGNLHLFQQGLVSFFQTVTMRTAGFATIDYSQAHSATNFIFIIQMIIGGAPGGTAGGIKLACAALIVLLFRSEFRGDKQVTFANRSIPKSIIRQMLTILVFFFTVFIMGYFFLLLAEPELSPFALLFETASALATVGVSMNITPQLSFFGRVIIMLLMFIGRVGPLTVLLSLSQKQKTPITYPKADITLG
ncbi:TrkH family potassium uptake protein [Streptococcus hillyeri]|uniref:TrkH family potassium uptake protein n=1 Tax=Streptococcus hillyeri TaxID=2282420 RepID=A0A3L9DKV5_9STRE|nr:potassium transporter TrkG [Streptococcus hillyeri]RLY01404.1 TrkH family potassium uptake protein [Streptococcus hillyeri]